VRRRLGTIRVIPFDLVLGANSSYIIISRLYLIQAEGERDLTQTRIKTFDLPRLLRSFNADDQEHRLLLKVQIKDK
jgi:hypothetical protein